MQIYWVGPLPAGVITAFLCKAIFRREADPEPKPILTEYDRKVNENDNIPLKTVLV